MFNVLYLHTHDTGRMISPYGYAVPTPHYAELAQDAVLFQNAFSVAPTCSPSRASLLTGTYPHQNGMLGLAHRGFAIDPSKHLATLLRDQGFVTGLCGVQHEVGNALDHHQAAATLGYMHDLSADLESGDFEAWDRQNAQNLATFLQNYHDERPFFLSYGQQATHRGYPTRLAEGITDDSSQPPLNVANTPETRHDFARFKTSIKQADANLGTVLTALKAAKLYEQTIIIVTTDHGIAFPFAKSNVNDAGTGVLLEMRVPGARRQEHSFDGLVSQLDVLPTLFELLNIEPPAYLEGRSFASVFNDDAAVGDDVVFAELTFHASYEPIRTVRTKRYRYVRYFDTTYRRINQANIDDSPTKAFYQTHDLAQVVKPQVALYDLDYDRDGINNVITVPRYQPIAVQLERLLFQHMQATSDPLLNGAIRFDRHWRINTRESLSPNAQEFEGKHHE